MVALGAAFLTWLGVHYVLKVTPRLDMQAGLPTSILRTVAVYAVVVWLDPHALPEVFGILGTAISTQTDERRVAFELGVISASWIWYFVIALGAGLMPPRITPRVARLFHQGSWIRDCAAGVCLLVLDGAPGTLIAPLSDITLSDFNGFAEKDYLARGSPFSHAKSY